MSAYIIITSSTRAAPEKGLGFLRKARYRRKRGRRPPRGRRLHFGER